MQIQYKSDSYTDKELEYLEKLYFNPVGEDIDLKKVDNFDYSMDKVMSYQTYQELKEVKQVGPFFLTVSEEDSDNINEIELIGKSNFSCLGIIDFTRPVGFNIPFINSYILNRTVVSTQKSLLKRLNGVMQSVLGQLQRVKGLHQKMVPIRSETIRGIKINSRFCAGTSSGGEFFEFFKNSQSLWLFSLNATSYITIGSFLSLVEMWREQNTLTKEFVTDSLKTHMSEFEGLGELSLFVCQINLISHDATIMNIGSHELLGKSKVVAGKNDLSYPNEKLDFKEINLRLDKGERFLLLSPGFFKNSNDKLNNESYYQFIKSHWIETNDLIQEITFQTKKKYNDLDFLPYDQTVLTIEVDKNAISKV